MLSNLGAPLAAQASVLRVTRSQKREYRAGAPQSSSSQRGREQGANAAAPALGGAVPWEGRPLGPRSSHSAALLPAHSLGCDPDRTAPLRSAGVCPRRNYPSFPQARPPGRHRPRPRVHENLCSRDAEYFRQGLGSEGDLTWFHTQSGTASTSVQLRRPARFTDCGRLLVPTQDSHRTRLAAVSQILPLEDNILRSPRNRE